MDVRPASIGFHSIRIEVDVPDTIRLEAEAGGHRIQRIPPTEKKGRVHTSTVTVSVTSAVEKKFNLDQRDVEIEWFSGTGKGGQNRNKVQNSCRLTHIPTGIQASAQTRDRTNSYKLALETLESRVIEQLKTESNKKKSLEKKTQVGSGMRGDKIRTYRFQDDIVCDHRSGKKSSATKILDGYFNLLW